MDKIKQESNSLLNIQFKDEPEEPPFDYQIAPATISCRLGWAEQMYQYFVYILASRRHGTLYIGVTNDLLRRVYEHRIDLNDGFTKEYQVHRLVYFEMTSDIRVAIWREKCLKKWNRAWKIRLIEEQNPTWSDLYEELW